ncbi:MAG: alpha/beta fold hydrolase [Deltaproteobacteria bacterium]|nr:alpha/beta fold hydrolase [Kofleriaceae bacterium]
MSIGSTRTSVGEVVWEAHGDASAPPMILLSANPGDRRDWDAVVPALAARHRVIALDWPGHGASPAPSPPQSASAMMYARVLAEVTEALGLERAIVCGNSVGGYAAIRLALEQPARVAALVLVDPGGFTRQKARLNALCRVKGTEWLTRRIAAHFARGYLRKRTPWTRQMIGRAEAERTNPDQIAVDAAIWRSFADPEHDLRARAGGVRQPTLLLWGTRDPVLPVFLDGRAARGAMPSARWVTLATGHAPHAENPTAFLAAVQPFLADVRR